MNRLKEWKKKKRKAENRKQVWKEKPNKTHWALLTVNQIDWLWYANKWRYTDTLWTHLAHNLKSESESFYFIHSHIHKHALIRRDAEIIQIIQVNYSIFDWARYIFLSFFFWIGHYSPNTKFAIRACLRGIPCDCIDSR